MARALRATAIQVEGVWGQYLREYSQFARKQDGTPKLIWKRSPYKDDAARRTVGEKLRQAVEEIRRLR